ncbi:MAG: N-acetylmuramoyl-L-alanine amidase [Pseudomonadota bacterium]
MTTKITWDPADNANYDRRIRSIVTHYTVLDEDASRDVLKHGGVGAHYLIPKERKEDGTDVWQFVKDTDRAWDAGISHWQARDGLNDTSLGIEIVGYGYGLAQESKDILWPYQVEDEISTLLTAEIKKDQKFYQLLVDHDLLKAFLADMQRSLVPPLKREDYKKYVLEAEITKYRAVTKDLREKHDPFSKISQADLYDLEKEGKLIWDEYTEHQRATLVSLIKQLCEDLKIKEGDTTCYEISPTAIIGHSDIAPGRKVDPGPKFPWKYLYEQGIGAWPDEEQVSAIKSKIGTVQEIDIAWVQDNLRCFGYQVKTTKTLDEQTQNAVRSFQMHFEPDNYSGSPSINTVSILAALIKKYFPKDYNPYPVHSLASSSGFFDVTTPISPADNSSPGILSCCKIC